MAADLTQNFLGKHFEKVIVAVAAAILVAAIVFFVAIRAPQDRVRTTVTQQVDSLEKPAKTPTIEGLFEGKPEELKKLGIGQPPVTVEDYKRELNGLSPSWDFTKDLVETYTLNVVPTTGIVRFQAPAVVPVLNVQAVAGRGTTNEVVSNAIFRLDIKPAALSDIVWVAVVGQVDLTAQLEAYIKADDPIQPVVLSRVEMVRRELKPDNTWTEWKPVVAAVSTPTAAKWPKMPANPRDAKAVMEWGSAVGAMQSAIRHMPLHHLVAIDEEGKLAESVAGPSTGVEQPDLAAAKAVVDAAAAAAAAAPAATDTAPAVTHTAPAEAVPSVGDLSPWARTTTTTPTRTTSAGSTTAAGTVATPKRVVVPVWAYDASVEPGKTYQYQMRIGLRSPIYGMNRAEKSAQWQPEFLGEWSAASREVTLPPTVQFYFVGSFGEKANIELQRWIMGQWIRVPSAPTAAGAPIVVIPPKRQKLLIPGGKGSETTKENVEIDMTPPGVLLVDILRNFMYVPEGNTRPIRTNMLIYTDTRGELKQRIEWDDKKAAANAWAARETVGGAVPAITPVTTPTVVRPPVVPPKTTPKTPTK
jgi:hypothetical protein